MITTKMWRIFVLCHNLNTGSINYYSSIFAKRFIFIFHMLSVYCKYKQTHNKFITWTSSTGQFGMLSDLITPAFFWKVCLIVLQFFRFNTLFMIFFSQSQCILFVFKFCSEWGFFLTRFGIAYVGQLHHNYVALLSLLLNVGAVSTLF